jgi:surface polysaccharide O-acyltransferase-like enzyme
MKLNKNSISAKLFRWFYRTSELPTNLCPYFWKLVMAYVFAIPVFIISLPYVIVDKDSHNQSLGERIGLGLFCWFILSLLIAALTPIILFWHTPVKGSLLESLIHYGFAVWVAGLFIGVMWFIHHLGEKIKERRNLPKEEKRSNIVVEMVKATYYKYCPKIDWN